MAAANRDDIPGTVAKPDARYWSTVSMPEDTLAESAGWVTDLAFRNWISGTGTHPSDSRHKTQTSK